MLLTWVCCQNITTYGVTILPFCGWRPRAGQSKSILSMHHFLVLPGQEKTNEPCLTFQRSKLRGCWPFKVCGLDFGFIISKVLKSKKHVHFIMLTYMLWYNKVVLLFWFEHFWYNKTEIKATNFERPAPSQFWPLKGQTWLVGLLLTR